MKKLAYVTALALAASVGIASAAPIAGPGGVTASDTTLVQVKETKKKNAQRNKSTKGTKSQGMQGMDMKAMKHQGMKGM